MQLRTYPNNLVLVYLRSHNSFDSLRFDSSAEHCHFEDFAGVTGNRCIECGSSSTSVDGQTTVDVFFQDPDISKNIFPFPTSLALIDTFCAYCLALGTDNLDSV